MAWKSWAFQCGFGGVLGTHSSVLAWRIPGTGEPGELLSVGSHRVGHDWSDLAAAAAGILQSVISNSQLFTTDIEAEGQKVR